MDTTNRGGERPHLLMCGTNGSSRTRRENSIQFEDIWGKNKLQRLYWNPGYLRKISKCIFATQNCFFSSSHRIYFSHTQYFIWRKDFFSHCFKMQACFDALEKIPSIIPNMMHILSFCTNLHQISISKTNIKHVVQLNSFLWVYWRGDTCNSNQCSSHFRSWLIRFVSDLFFFTSFVFLVFAFFSQYCLIAHHSSLRPIQYEWVNPPINDIIVTSFLFLCSDQ